MFRSQVMWVNIFVYVHVLVHYITLFMHRYGTHNFTHTSVWHVTQERIHRDRHSVGWTGAHILSSSEICDPASFVSVIFTNCRKQNLIPTHWTYSRSSITLDVLFTRYLLRISTVSPAVLFEDFRGFPHAFRSNVGQYKYTYTKNRHAQHNQQSQGDQFRSINKTAMFRIHENPYSRPSTCERDPNLLT
jgi:hypothetical protein